MRDPPDVGNDTFHCPERADRFPWIFSLRSVSLNRQCGALSVLEVKRGRSRAATFGDWL
jgi:hypothetical protein